MASFIFFLLLFSAASAQQPGSNITLGSSLTPTKNSTWLSPSGLFAFGFFPQNKDSFAVGIFFSGIPEKTVVWTANADSPTVSKDATLQLTLDGRLVVQQRGRQDEEIVIPRMAISSASMLDNGNFVLYNNNSVIWQSFDNPTNTILSGQRLSPNSELVASASETDYTRGFFRLAMQSDGNLVQYPRNGQRPEDAYYATNTNGAGNNVSLNLGSNGHLYLFNGKSIVTDFTLGYPTQRTIYLFRIDVDGLLRLYSRSLNREGRWNATWSSSLDKCDPKGICGINSFCFLQGDGAGCKCLPGFYSIQPGNQTAGCARNFTAEICGDKNSVVKYEMKKEENTRWDDSTYDALNTDNEEGCLSACLDDCNCEAAFFKDGRCKKQKLPLIYGKKLQNESNAALIKVGMSTSRLETNGVSSNSGKEIIKKELRLDILGTSIAIVIGAVLFVGASLIYVHRKHAAYTKITEQGEAILNEDVAPRAFTYAGLVTATNDFSEELGKGASGTVFKGILQSSQKVVAVKRLEKESGGEKEFQTEMKIIGKTYHRNLVRLFGYSHDGPKRLLVFEYMSRGSLADILFNPGKQPRWEERINIARDIARGILYLHEECDTQIIHCDIKSQNILMDEQGCAKISDFGLSKLLKKDQTNTYTGIRGTKGYVAPEWHGKQPITVKVDVYSFGIVLLEIICCRKSINWNLSEDEAVLEEWVYDCYVAGEVGNLVGDEVVDKRKLERIVKVGLWCIQYEPSLRPSMKKVLLMLEGTVDIPVPPNPTSFLSSTAT